MWWNRQQCHVVCSRHFNDLEIARVGQMAIEDKQGGITFRGLDVMKEVLEPGLKYVHLHPPTGMVGKYRPRWRTNLQLLIHPDAAL